MGGRKIGNKSLFTTNMDVELMEEIRNCIAALAGTDNELRLSDFFDKSARAELRRQKLRLNNGESFPERANKKLKSGRPFRKSKKVFLE